MLAQTDRTNKMRKCLLLLLALASAFYCFAAEDDINSWNSDSSVAESKAKKEVSLDLSSGTKRAVVGFSNIDVSLSEHPELGAFEDIPDSNVYKSVNLEIDLETGEASIGKKEDFYVFYQFVSSEPLALYLYTDEKLTGSSSGDTIDFEMYRNSSERKITYIDTSSNVGLGTYSDKKDVYTHSSDRYAWADGLQIIIETKNADLLNKKADRYSSNIYVVVKNS